MDHQSEKKKKGRGVLTAAAIPAAVGQDKEDEKNKAKRNKSRHWNREQPAAAAAAAAPATREDEEEEETPKRVKGSKEEVEDDGELGQRIAERNKREEEQYGADAGSIGEVKRGNKTRRRRRRQRQSADQSLQYTENIPTQLHRRSSIPNMVTVKGTQMT